MITILALTPLTHSQQETIRNVSPDLNLRVAASKELTADLLAQTDILLTMQLDNTILAQAPRLKWIQATSAGVDKMLTGALIDSPIQLTNVRGMHGSTISEFVLSMMFALGRELPRSIRHQATHTWERVTQRMLDGSTVGIVGVGGIGQEIARKAKALGMRTLGVKRNTAQPVSYVDQLFAPGEIDQMLMQADYVVLACPLTEETRGIINAETLTMMKPTAYLVNISRGEVVEEPALIDALRQGRIAGAALDVFTQEPLPEDSPLWELPNVIVTAHVAGSMADYMDRATAIFAENLRRFLAGETLNNLVDKKLGY